ncbi:MAG: ABC-2 family transporter protein [Candidatus Daviesbacteria bacterium]
MIKKYLKVFWLISKSAVLVSLNSRYGAVFFIFGKVLRIVTFSYFLFILVSSTKTLANYTVLQTILFFLVFNLVDSGAQFLFRDVYRFRSRVVNGELDGYFSKPISPLLRSLLGGIDVLDFVVLIPLFGVIVWLIPQVATSIFQIILFGLLLINSFIIATAFHIFVLGLGITTTEVDHAIMMYRDFTSMGKIPIDVYRYPISAIFSTIIPIGVMMTLPAKALMGLASPQAIVISLAIGISVFYLSLKYWNYAVTKYSSASS